MYPKKIWANLTVKDVKRSQEFYAQLGFKPNGPNTSTELASFLFSDENFVIHFFAEGSQIDEYLPPRTNKTSEIIFTLSAETEAEVNEWMNTVKNAGGTIIKEAGRDKNNYYVFVFADPDGHTFNVLLMENGM